jgi:PAS domain-containing protein
MRSATPVGVGPGTRRGPGQGQPCGAATMAMSGPGHDRLLRAVIDGAPDALLVLDGRTGTVVDCNPAAERLTGRRRDTLLGRGLADLGPSRQATGERATQAAHDRLDAAMRDGITEFDWRIVRPEQVSVACTVRLVHTSDPPASLVVAYVWEHGAGAPARRRRP